MSADGLWRLSAEALAARVREGTKAEQAVESGWEGPAREWEPEVESARQTYRMLAEQAEERGDKTSADKHREDLESTIRLSRMDLAQLQGLDLPKQ